MNVNPAFDKHRRRSLEGGTVEGVLTDESVAEAEGVVVRNNVVDDDSEDETVVLLEVELVVSEGAEASNDVVDDGDEDKRFSLLPAPTEVLKLRSSLVNDDADVLGARAFEFQTVRRREK